MTGHEKVWSILSYIAKAGNLDEKVTGFQANAGKSFVILPKDSKRTNYADDTLDWFSHVFSFSAANLCIVQFA